LPLIEPDSRPLLLRGPSLGLRFVVLAALSIGLMIADHRQQHLETIRRGLTAAAYPFQWLAGSPFMAAAWLSRTTKTRAELESENVVLAADNLKLMLRLQRFEALEAENQRLRAASGRTTRIVQRSLVTEILRVDLDPHRQRVLLNRGTNDGVFVGQAALDAQGIVGQVTRVGPLSAELILISDAQHAIPVSVVRNGLRTIAVGTGRPTGLTLPYLPKNADIQKGDLVVSSGLGGVFPPGYPVARIAEVRRDPSEPLLVVSAEPLARLDRDPEVLLVWFDNRVPPLPEGPSASAPPAAAGTMATPGKATSTSQPAGTATTTASPVPATTPTPRPATASPAPSPARPTGSAPCAATGGRRVSQSWRQCCCRCCSPSCRCRTGSNCCAPTWSRSPCCGCASWRRAPWGCCSPGCAG
jgi:rod shape-determining protein MreC